MSDGTRAAITSLAAEPSGVSITAETTYERGIGRVGFVLVDLGGAPDTGCLDRGDVDFSAPLPTHVREAWRSDVALLPGSYRAFFHVYDRSGVNLVAYDRCDFSCGEGR